MDWSKVVYPGLAALFTAALFSLLGVVGKAPTLIIPGQAVVAFNSSECPSGWKEYELGQGRVIVGVGNALDLEPRTLEELGGKEEVTLSINELPKHRHNNPSVGNTPPSLNKVYALQAGGRGEYDGAHARPTDYKGKGAAHENMPPFVALRYCIKG